MPACALTFLSADPLSVKDERQYDGKGANVRQERGTHQGLSRSLHVQMGTTCMGKPLVTTELTGLGVGFVC